MELNWIIGPKNAKKIMKNVKNSQRNQKIIKYNSLESQILDFLSYKLYLNWSIS